MRTKEQLLERPNYLLETYQNEIYRQVKTYMEQNNLSQKDFAKRLGEISGRPGPVSESYISQILNGHFNFTLKKLIELSIAIGKAPVLGFENIDDYWNKAEQKQPKDKKRKLTTRKKNNSLKVNIQNWV